MICALLPVLVVNFALEPDHPALPVQVAGVVVLWFLALILSEIVTCIPVIVDVVRSVSSSWRPDFHIVGRFVGGKLVIVDTQAISLSIAVHE